jgi:hypothetical protein
MMQNFLANSTMLPTTTVSFVKVDSGYCAPKPPQREEFLDQPNIFYGIQIDYIKSVLISSTSWQ